MVCQDEPAESTGSLLIGFEWYFVGSLLAIQLEAQSLKVDLSKDLQLSERDIVPSAYYYLVEVDTLTRVNDSPESAGQLFPQRCIRLGRAIRYLIVHNSVYRKRIVLRLIVDFIGRCQVDVNVEQFECISVEDPPELLLGWLEPRLESVWERDTIVPVSE